MATEKTTKIQESIAKPDVSMYLEGKPNDEKRMNKVVERALRIDKRQTRGAFGGK